MTLWNYKSTVMWTTVALFLAVLMISACDPDTLAALNTQANGDVASSTPQSDDRVAVSADFQIRPIEEVFASDPPQLIDITDSDATLIFVSNIPLACSIVYGETTAYGNLALDKFNPSGTFLLGVGL